jgi:hypothetical protein
MGQFDFQLPQVPSHSFAPQIASMGELISSLMQRRQQMDMEQQQADLRREDSQRKEKRDNDVQDRFIRRLESQDNRAGNELYQKSVHNAAGALGKGATADQLQLELAGSGATVSPELGPKPELPMTSTFMPPSTIAGYSENIQQTDADPAPVEYEAYDRYNNPFAGADQAVTDAPPTGKLQVTSPNRPTITLDPSAAQKQQEAENLKQVANIDSMVANKLPVSPAMLDYANSMRAGLKMSGSNVTSMRNADANIAGRSALQDQKSTDQMVLQEKKHEYTLAEIMARGKARRSGKGRGGMRASVSGDEASMENLSFKDQVRVSGMIERPLKEGLRAVNWYKFEGPGVDRMKLAKVNIAAEGKDAAAQHVEAMMNFFGYIRGGVPALNETREWQRMSGSLFTWMEEAGRGLGIENLGQSFQKFLSGDPVSEKDKVAFKEGLSRMAPSRRDALAKAINVTVGELQAAGKKALLSVAKRFKHYGAEVRTGANDALNGYAEFLSLPDQDWIGQTRGDASTGEAQPETQAAPEQGQSTPAAAPSKAFSKIKGMF